MQHASALAPCGVGSSNRHTSIQLAISLILGHCDKVLHALPLGTIRTAPHSAIVFFLETGHIFFRERRGFIRRVNNKRELNSQPI